MRKLLVIFMGLLPLTACNEDKLEKDYESDEKKCYPTEKAYLTDGGSKSDAPAMGGGNFLEPGPEKGETVRFTLDSANRLASQSTTNYARTYSYDEEGRLSIINEMWLNSLTYKYAFAYHNDNTLKQLKLTEYPDAESRYYTYEYSYDSEGNLSRIVRRPQDSTACLAQSGHEQKTWTYNPDGQVSHIELRVSDGLGSMTLKEEYSYSNYDDQKSPYLNMEALHIPETGYLGGQNPGYCRHVNHMAEEGEDDSTSYTISYGYNSYGYPVSVFRNGAETFKYTYKYVDGE
jgi:YD repeat-containing protein